MNGLLKHGFRQQRSPSRERCSKLGLVVVLAAAAPLIGQVLRLPSILVLLALGFGAGAVGALDPNALLGQQLISAVVSVCRRDHSVRSRARPEAQQAHRRPSLASPADW